MSGNFRDLFGVSVGMLRTHHVFINVDDFISACHEVPIKKYLGKHELHSQNTKRGALYWYEDDESKTPKMPLKVLAKAAFFQSKGDWLHKSVNPVFKRNLWEYLDKNILPQEFYNSSSINSRDNSDYHLIELIAQINLQVRRFDEFKNKSVFTKDDELTLKLLHIWYRVLQKQAVGHLVSHNMDITDSKVMSRITGVILKI